MADHSGTSAATAKLAEILNVTAADSLVVESERDRLLNERARTARNAFPDYRRSNARPARIRCSSGGVAMR
jgi:hypothetical protein